MDRLRIEVLFLSGTPRYCLWLFIEFSKLRTWNEMQELNSISGNVVNLLYFLDASVENGGVGVDISNEIYKWVISLEVQGK